MLGNFLGNKIGKSRVSSGQEAAGLTYLKANGHLLYDFTAQSGNEDDSITAPTDLTGNGNDGVLGIANVVTPKVKIKTLGINSYKSCSIIGNDKSCVLIPVSDWIGTSHEIWITARWDGLEGRDVTRFLIGLLNTAVGVNPVLYQFTLSNIYEHYHYFQDTSQANNEQYRSQAFGFDNADNQGQMVFRFIIDWTAEDMRVDWQNAQYTIPDRRNIKLSGINESEFVTENYISLGKRYRRDLTDIDAVGIGAEEMNFFRVAITPLITEQSDVNNVYEYMALNEDA